MAEEPQEINNQGQENPAPNLHIAQETEPVYSSTIYPTDGRGIDENLFAVVSALEEAIQKPVILVIQRNSGPIPGRPHPMSLMGSEILAEFYKAIESIKHGQKVAVVVDSPGGYAESAFRLARFFRKHCGGYSVYVPRLAKSAATLFALGAEEIVLNQFAELGPLDAQIDDMDRELQMSALDEVHAIERLNVAAMKAVEAQMLHFMLRTGKKIETLLPMTMQFVSDMMKPLFEKIDTIHYTLMSRTLKVGTEYAKRLLHKRYGDAAENIADALTNNYPDHGFSIDIDEAQAIGLRATEANETVRVLLDKINELTTGYNILGRIVKG